VVPRNEPVVLSEKERAVVTGLADVMVGNPIVERLARALEQALNRFDGKG
jgi:hypothetical protein